MMTSRNEVLKMLRQMETGQQISADELLNLAATIEKDEMKVEQKQDQVKQQEDREPVAEIPDPNIPTPDEAVMVPAESVNSLGSCAPATSTRCFRSAAAFDPTTLADKEFSVAGKIWLESRRVHLRQRVLYGYQHHCKWLTVHFGGMKLRDIHIGHVMAYQTQRAENADGKWPRKAGPSIINHELSFLQTLLKVSNLWSRIADLYKPLPLPSNHKHKVMSEGEKRRFYAVAASSPEWQLALNVATITNHTTAAGTELRHLRLVDVVLDGNYPRITVNADTAKNGFRERTINLNEEARAAMAKCVERSKALGSSRPEHFVFPFRDRDQQSYDPTRPASESWLSKEWASLRTAAGLPWLTPHCLRHQAITELAEAGVAPDTIKKIAGHVTDKMLDHYSHQRFEHQAAALNLLGGITIQSCQSPPGSPPPHVELPALRSSAFSRYGLLSEWRHT